MILLFLM